MASDALMVWMRRFSEKFAVIGALSRNEIGTSASRKIESATTGNRCSLPTPTARSAAAQSLASATLLRPSFLAR